MLRSYVTKKHLTFYFLAIVITWLEAIITPALIQYIGACPGLGWEALLLCSFDD